MFLYRFYFDVLPVLFLMMLSFMPLFLFCKLTLDDLKGATKQNVLQRASCWICAGTDKDKVVDLIAVFPSGCLSIPGPHGNKDPTTSMRTEAGGVAKTGSRLSVYHSPESSAFSRLQFPSLKD